jgi:hypothetical protein
MSSRTYSLLVWSGNVIRMTTWGAYLSETCWNDHIAPDGMVEEVCRAVADLNSLAFLD